MKTLDRPIFPDYWERFNLSVDIMRTKKCRTVFRLTMIEGFNMGEENLPEYKDIFDRGQPNFVEIKRLTPAFSASARSVLGIKNVPKWEDMKAYAERLCKVILDGETYSVASVHEHSGCVLLAHKRFIIGGIVHTWINYDKFDAHVEGGTLSSMTPEDYLLPTPPWALPSSPSEGFDPTQERHVTPKKKKYLETLR
ncbi:hypothetical protein AGDE_05659 [Angomonas deanei]|uniref:Wyosine base formation, putative n=1 Tax=Angomonas deanei TaxID=59799 RepID=A0A7G2CQA7_9TRYP|nr:hypothetical protein AGDE_05659 [Angomonas deanei]CAD2222008.1 Wyosine base formation, putative [Angomonas deanei]|eukprot:EPY38270.1 hypothetical protein AGDE_05659 [Angomonas deanei]